MSSRALFLGLVFVAWIFGSAVLVVAGPTSKPRSGTAPVLEPDPARRAGLSPQDITDASRIYTAKCMRCHKSYEPAAYPEPEWNSWMIKMRKKAHLAPGQDKLLSRYLDAYRSGHTNGLASNSAPGPNSNSSAP